jgi:hypothetical protein
MTNLIFYNIPTLNNKRLKVIHTEFKLDPLDYYLSGDGGMDEQILLDYVGILPYWAVESIQHGGDIVSNMSKLYGMGNLFEMSGQTVETNGVLKFPGDPDMSPIAQLVSGSCTFFFYEYSIVAIRQGSNIFVTRMD